MQMSSYTIAPYDFPPISLSRLYAVVASDDHYVARGLEYDEAAVELLTLNGGEYAIRPDGDRFRLHWGSSGELRPTAIVEEDEGEVLRRVIGFCNVFSNYRVVEEELTCASWWEFTCLGEETLHAWGDDDHAETWIEHLNRQSGSGSDGPWQIRELRIRDAFALDLHVPHDGLDLAEAIEGIRPELLDHFDGALSSVALLTAPSLFEVNNADIEESVRAALRAGDRLEMLGVTQEDTRAAILALLESQGWTLAGSKPVRLEGAAA
ncbi:hypothetical protein [Rhizobium sp. P007]|uniref:hypothetical protein n=1 Tax=Rhizobium sp. P007 TaxID=285908 RepID=UPI00115AAA3F|nr:hypothetical protein [Rhizobium sp. P007]CAD7058596.1 hypothetical protein RP007_02600 [Rhizobium sp. P007]